MREFINQFEAENEVKNLRTVLASKVQEIAALKEESEKNQKLYEENINIWQRKYSDKLELEIRIEAYKKAEKETSDAYLRIRELVGAWDTKPGGIDRFEVTENKIKEMKKKLAAYEKALEEQLTALERIFKVPIEPQFDSDPIGQIEAMCAIAEELIKAYRAGREGKKGTANEG